MTNYIVLKTLLGGNVYAEVKGNNVYFQIPWSSGTLACKYTDDGGNWKNFDKDATYHDYFAQCSPWNKGNPSRSISLSLNGVTYNTNENTAISNGAINGKYY